jgi:hypothetical protein
MKPRLYIRTKNKKKKWIPAWKNFILNCGIPIGDWEIDRHLESHYNARFINNWRISYIEFETQADLDFFNLKWAEHV